MTDTITRHCANGMHGFCAETRDTCACTECHFGPCERCGADNLRTMYSDNTLCASCERSDARERSKRHVERCKCGKPGAFLNPANRGAGHLCTGCHADAGVPVMLTSSVAGLASACKGANVDDERHVWVHIRGSRFHCLCGVKKYDAALRARRTRELENELF